MAQTPFSAQADWTYFTSPLDTASQHFGPFAELVELWRGRADTPGWPPRRGAFQVEDFIGWLGRIFIARVEREPFDLRYTLWGTTLVEWWGVDYTNKTLGSESSDPEIWAGAELEYFKEMDRTPFIGIASGYLTLHDRSHIQVIAVDLPCFENRVFTHVISAHLRIGEDEEETLESLLPGCPLTRFTAPVRRTLGHR